MQLFIFFIMKVPLINEKVIDLKKKLKDEINDECHEKTDLKVFVVVIPKEGWARVAAPILLLA